MKKQVKLSNNSESWDSNRRYKVNALVTYNGTEWQNTTGINSEPTLTSTDWIKVGSTTSYQVYTALLTQVGTSAPTAIVLENTIGNIVWSRNTVGVYAGTLVGAFTANKSFCVTNLSDYGITVTNFGSEDLLNVETRNLSGGNVDDFLNKTSIEIRVYN